MRRQRRDVETSCDLRRQLAWHGGVSVACLYARDCLFSLIRSGYGAAKGQHLLSRLVLVLENQAEQEGPGSMNVPIARSHCITCL